MSLSNRHGTPVDPVPFIVVAGLSSMLLLSFGPLYGQAYGLPLWAALTVSVACSLLATALAFYWQVWDARPVAEAPIEPRVQRLFYGALAFAVVVVGLTVPLLI